MDDISENEHLPVISTSLRCLAVFDFDGTITFKDSLADFLRFAVGKVDFFLLGLTAIGILTNYALRRVSNSDSKLLLLQHFLDGWSAERFRTVAQRYSMQKLPQIIRSDAMQQIKRHQELGHEVVVVSASIEDWLEAWCARHQLSLIGTRVELSEDGSTPLRYATDNCYGKEKVNRLLQHYEAKQFDCTYAYGDSAGDTQIIEWADKGWLKLFKSRQPYQ